jgi:hypothetical protein
MKMKLGLKIEMENKYQGLYWMGKINNEDK